MAYQSPENVENLPSSSPQADDHSKVCMSFCSGSSKEDPGVEEFFNCIHNNDVIKLRKYFRSLEFKPWEFIEKGGFTAAHRASYLNFTDLFMTLIEEFSMRLEMDHPNDVKPMIRDWLNIKSNEGYTVLHYASFRGNMDIIQLLYDFEVDSNARNIRGVTPFHMAAQGDKPNSLVFLKEKFKANIMETDNDKTTALHWACYTGAEYTFQYLLAFNRLSINSQNNDGMTPLHLAIISEKTRIVKRLLQKGAETSLKDNKERDCMQLAKEKNKFEVVEMLKENDNCQLCVLHNPVRKTEKSYVNVLLFILLHVFIESVNFFLLLPHIDNEPVALIYIFLLLLTSSVFGYLIWISKKINVLKNKNTLLDLLDTKQELKDYCAVCLVKKYSETKHCSICDICIEDFDHHCYWINNCIGKENFKEFLAFVFVIFINLLYNIGVILACMNYTQIL